MLPGQRTPSNPACTRSPFLALPGVSFLRETQFPLSFRRWSDAACKARDKVEALPGITKALRALFEPDRCTAAGLRYKIARVTSRVRARARVPDRITSAEACFPSRAVVDSYLVTALGIINLFRGGQRSRLLRDLVNRSDVLITPESHD